MEGGVLFREGLLVGGCLQPLEGLVVQGRSFMAASLQTPTVPEPRVDRSCLTLPCPRAGGGLALLRSEGLRPIVGPRRAVRRDEGSGSLDGAEEVFAALLRIELAQAAEPRVRAPADVRWEGGAGRHELLEQRALLERPGRPVTQTVQNAVDGDELEGGEERQDDCASDAPWAFED